MTEDISNIKRYKFILNSIEEGLRNTAKNEVKILDVGCGNGNLDNFLAKAGFGNITGIDIDTDSLAAAKLKYSRINFICEDISSYLLSSKLKYWDFIICSEVLEHIDKPEEIVRHLARISKDNGRLLLTIPNGYGPWEICHRKAQRTHYSEIGNELKGRYHVQRFTYGDIVRIISKEGFKLIEFKNSNFVSSVWPFNIPAYHAFDLLEKFDCCLADYLPRCFSSGWYFCFELEKHEFQRYV